MHFVFFFFKQKTAYEITYGDWSSDVCSSDLKFRERFSLNSSMRRSSCRRFAAAGAWKAGENLVCSAAENRSAGGLNGQGQRSVQDEISGQQERPDRRSRIRGRRRRAGSKGMEERRLSGEKGQPGF